MPENQEGLIYSKIIRHIAEQLAETELAAGAEDLTQTVELFQEISEAFENAGGFEHQPEQALPLSHAFAMLSASMQALSQQAADLGHDNAAAKMQWASQQAKTMTATLEERHLNNAGGVVALDLDLHEPGPIGPAANDGGGPDGTVH